MENALIVVDAKASTANAGNVNKSGESPDMERKLIEHQKRIRFNRCAHTESHLLPVA